MSDQTPAPKVRADIEILLDEMPSAPVQSQRARECRDAFMKWAREELEKDDCNYDEVWAEWEKINADDESGVNNSESVGDGQSDQIRPYWRHLR